MSRFNKVRIEDSLGYEPEVGLFGALKTSNPTTQISHTFVRPLDTVREFSIASATGTGSVAAQYNRSLLKCSSGTTGTAQLQTRTVLRYKTATTIETYFTASFIGSGVGVAGHTALIGLFDDADGVYLGYSGTNFIVGYRNKYLSGYVVPASSGDPDVTAVVDMSAYDLTKIHRFRIKFGYLGVGNISFEVFYSNKWQLLHTFTTDGTLSNRTHVGTAILPMRCEVSSTSADITILSGSWNAQTYDKLAKIQDKPFFTAGFRSVTPATAGGNPIVAFRSKLMFGGYPSKIHSQLLFSEFGTGSEGLYRINLFLYPAGTFIDGNPATVGATEIKGNFVDIDVNSVLETSTDIAKGGSVVLPTVPRFSTTLAVPSSGSGVASANLDFEKLGMIAAPGTEMLVTMEEIIGGVGTDTTSWSIAYLDLT